jgi:3-oxoacyl-[acyl-carrier-protein] synthase II
MGLGVAITGRGVVSALGHTPAELTDRLGRDELAIKPTPWSEPDRAEWWAPIEDFHAGDWMDRRVESGTNPFARYALAGAVTALADAGIDQPDPLRTAVVIGTTMGGATSLERAQFDADTRGPRAIAPKAMIAAWPNMAAAQITMRWGLHGPCLTVSTACASSLDAIGTGARLVSAGVADVAIVGGTEAGLGVGVGEHGFVPASGRARTLYGMSVVGGPARAASRPFDRHRGGMVMGEGAGMLVLESARHAADRGARVHAWIEGYGSLSDAHHPSSPDPSGQWEQLAMRLALDEAGLSPSDVDAIVAHGTGTPKGDAAEIQAINGLFGDRAQPVPVTSVKGGLGHPAAAAGALSLLVGVEGMSRGELVHTACTTDVDPEVEFDLVLKAPRALSIDVLQVNAFGFGGQNASLVLRGHGG